MLKRILLILIICLLYSVNANAAPAEVNAYVPNAKKVGEAKYKGQIGYKYTAQLYAPNGKFDPDQPYAIRFVFLNEMDGKEMAQCAIDEIRSQGFTDQLKLATWHQRLEEILPDVNEGSVLTAINDKYNFTLFLDGDRNLGEIKEEMFSELFFGIWLGYNSREPEARKLMLGTDTVTY